jgi:hypothetical protein
MRAPTVAEAAAEAGVSEATLRRWLQTEEFTDLYDYARRRVLDAAVVQIQSLTGAAVAKLGELLDCGIRATELRAAQEILDLAFRARQLYEHEERIKGLERLAADEAAEDRSLMSGFVG